MRRLAGLLAVLACLLLPVTLTASWLADNVDDSGTYVATVAPLAKNPQVRAALTPVLVDEVMGLLEAQSPVPFTPTVRTTVRRIVHAGIARAVRAPQMQTAWKRFNRKAHAEVLAALHGKRVPTDSRGRLLVSAQPLVSAVVAAATRSLPIPISVRVTTDVRIPLVPVHDLHAARPAYRALNSADRWLPWALGGSAVLALLLGSPRRRIVGILAYGSILTLAALEGALYLERQRVVAAAGPTYRTLSGAVWDQVTSTLHHRIEIGLVIAVAVAIVHALALAFGIGRR